MFRFTYYYPWFLVRVVTLFRSIKFRRGNKLTLYCTSTVYDLLYILHFNNDNNNNIYYLQLGCHPVAVFFFPCIQNVKLVTNKFKSGGLHEKHVVATLGTISAFAFEKKIAFFWVSTQLVVAVSYRRFGTTCRSHHRCIITRKNAVLPLSRGGRLISRMFHFTKCHIFCCCLSPESKYNTRKLWHFDDAECDCYCRLGTWRRVVW